MITRLNFGQVRLTVLTISQTTLSIRSTASVKSRLTTINVGQRGPAGEGVDNFSTELLARYILAKS